MNPFEDSPHVGDFFVSCDRSLIDNRWLVNHLLAQSWTECWTHERLAEAVANSLVFGVYERVVDDEKRGPAAPNMVGFGRVITDGATYSLVSDIVIQESYRGRGLAKFLMAVIVSHPSVRRTVSVLRTSNMQRLYGKFGYESVQAMRRIPKE